MCGEIQAMVKAIGYPTEIHIPKDWIYLFDKLLCASCTNTVQKFVRRKPNDT